MIKFSKFEGLINYGAEFLTKKQCAQKAIDVGMDVGNRMKNPTPITIEELQTIINNRLGENSVFVTNSIEKVHELLKEVGNTAYEVFLDPKKSIATTLPGKGGKFIYLPTLSKTEQLGDYNKRLSSDIILSHELNHCLLANHTKEGRVAQQYLNKIAVGKYKKIMEGNNAQGISEAGLNLQSGTLRKFLIGEQKLYATMEQSRCNNTEIGCKLFQTVKDGFFKKITNFYSKLSTPEAVNSEIESVVNTAVPSLSSLNKNGISSIRSIIGEESSCYEVQSTLARKLLNIPDNVLLIDDFSSSFLKMVHDFLEKFEK